MSWNTRDLLRRCLESTAPEVRAGRAEAWVVDNASADGSVEMVENEFPWANLLPLADNVGFGRAVNIVGARTNAKWLGVANADIELEPGALERLLEAGLRHPGAGIVAPRLVLPDGTTQHSVYAFPTLAFTLAFNLGIASITPGLSDRLMLEGQWNAERSRRVDWAIGAFALVRREVWEATGGFPPEQWMYAEDLDLGWRAAARGWQTWYEPAARVHHRGAASTSQLWGDERDVLWQRSTYAWMLRRRGLLITRVCALINTAGAAARLAGITLPALVLGGERRARWRALRRWTRLHIDGLRAPRAALESHR